MKGFFVCISKLKLPTATENGPVPAPKLVADQTSLYQYLRV